MFEIYEKSCEKMDEVEDNSVHLVVTSPPYNVGCEYDEPNDRLPLEKYIELQTNVCSELWRVLIEGGRVFINVPNLYRKPMIPLPHYFQKIMFDIGFQQFAQIVWFKGGSGFHSLKFGSYEMATEPNIRSSHEFILGFYKKNYRREKPDNYIPEIWRYGEWELYSREEWMINTVTEKITKHPAAFPLEIPYRLIKLESFIGDTVLDPFLGSGSTLQMAKKLGRNGIGYEISKKYCKLAHKNIGDVDKTTQLDFSKFIDYEKFLLKKEFIP